MQLLVSTIVKWRAAACTGVAASFVAFSLAQADALRAAGVNGRAPSGAGAIKGFVSTITDNALWIIGTTAALAILLIGALFFFGHSRAQDYAARIAVGAVIVVAAPGIAS
jgi:hypothetical protein